MADARYHVRFRDEASGDELGLMLVESPQLGFTKRLVNPYAAKGSQGDTQDSDLTEWSVSSFRDWRGGRGQEVLEDRARFLDAWNLETRIEGQLTLGPLPQNPLGEAARYEPGDAEVWDRWAFGYPGGGPLNEQYDPGWTHDFSAGLKLGQRVKFKQLSAAFDYRIASVEVRVKKGYDPTAALRLAIWSDTVGEGYGDGLPDEELAYVEVAAGSIPTSFDWVTFTFTTPVDLADAGGGYYWVVLSTLENGGGKYWWMFEVGDPYPDGFQAREEADEWISMAYMNGDYAFRTHFAPIKMGMSFDAPVGGVSCTTVYLYLGQLYYESSLTVKLCEDNSGEPGTVLQTKEVTIEGVVSPWYRVVWDSAEALASETTYWITAEHTSEQDHYYIFLLWGGDQTGEYGDGSAVWKLGDGSWTALAGDLFFRVNEDDTLDDTVVAFARYNDNWYCGAGDTVYEWDEEATGWVASDTQSGDDVTALETWGGYLWAARGTACYLRKYNGSSWANDGTNYAQLLKAGGGYLHRTDPTSVNYLYYTADGSTWSSAIVVGPSDHAITGMAWFRDMLVVSTATRLWGVAAEIAYPLLDWSSQEDADNGVNMFYWAKTGALYVPLQFGLYRWNGDTMVAVGPEQGTGLPADRAGKIAAITGTGNWLFVAVDAGTDGRSSVLAYGGVGGWHELQRAEQTGQRIRALGFETISSPSRLWLGLGSETRYLMLPDYTDNPYQWSGYEFNSIGEVITSWMGGDLLEVVKDLWQVVVRGEDFSDDQRVEIYLEVDRSGQWEYVGEVAAYPRTVLTFGESSFYARTVGSGSTRGTIEVDDTSGLVMGDWCRFSSGEVAQIASITDGDTFVLETALESAPESGDLVYASGPAGREFRLKLVLSTTDKTATPKVGAVFVRYQNNVLDRFMYSLQIRVEDGLEDLVGNPYPHTAATLRVALDGWAKRARSFTLYDPDGVTHTVKATSVGEGGWVRRPKAEQAAGYQSVYSLNLVEVA